MDVFKMFKIETIKQHKTFIKSQNKIAKNRLRNDVLREDIANNVRKFYRIFSINMCREKSFVKIK